MQLSNVMWLASTPFFNSTLKWCSDIIDSVWKWLVCYHLKSPGNFLVATPIWLIYHIHSTKELFSGVKKILPPFVYFRWSIRFGISDIGGNHWLLAPISSEWTLAATHCIPKHLQRYIGKNTDAPPSVRNNKMTACNIAIFCVSVY